MRLHADHVRFAGLDVPADEQGDLRVAVDDVERHAGVARVQLVLGADPEQLVHRSVLSDTC